MSFPKTEKNKNQIQLVGYLTPTLLVEIVHPSDKNLSINGYCDIMGQLGLLFVCFYVTKKPSRCHEWQASIDHHQG